MINLYKSHLTSSK